MKLKHLESALSQVRYMFDEPRIELEQYPTSPHLTACVCLAAYERGDLSQSLSSHYEAEGSSNAIRSRKTTRIVDLGCGTGMLSIGCALLMSSLDEECHIIAVDIDESALDQAKENVQEMEVDHMIDFIQAQLQYEPSPTTTTSTLSSRTGKPYQKGSKQARRGGNGPARGGRTGKGGRGVVQQQQQQQRQSSQNSSAQSPLHHSAEINFLVNDNDDEFPYYDGIPLQNKCADVVFINPPFGTKHNAGIDVAFLKVACRLSTKAVYSFHKTSTRSFMKKCAQQIDMNFDLVAEMKFDIPSMYKFHKEKCVFVEVDLIRFSHNNSNSNNSN